MIMHGRIRRDRKEDAKRRCEKKMRIGRYRLQLICNDHLPSFRPSLHSPSYVVPSVAQKNMPLPCLLSSSHIPDDDDK